MKTLEDRITDLEKSLQRWKLAAAFGGLALLAAVCVAANGPVSGVADVVKTHRLEVIDNDAHVLTSIFATDGVGTFVMSDRDDHPHISMMADPTGAVVDFAGTEKHVGISTQTKVADKAMITITEWKTKEPKTLWQAP